MPMMKHEPILFIFNSPLSSGCDYVVRTITIVSHTHPSYAIALGDIVSLWQFRSLHRLWGKKTINGAIVVQPISVLPGVRFRIVRMIVYAYTAILMRAYLVFKYPLTAKTFWFFEPFHMQGIQPVLFGYKAIYDCVDYYPGFHVCASKEHNVLLKRATYVFANSEILARELQRVRADVHAVPLGFAPELFERAYVRHIAAKKKPFVVGYIGSMSDRMDFSLLRKVVKELSDVHFMFIGDIEPNVFGVNDHAGADFRRLCRNANVRWVPGIPKQEIPKILSQIDIGIIPYRIDREFNRYAFPMKLMEYFAAGRPVIATDMHALRVFRTQKLVRIIYTPKDFIREIRDIRYNGWDGKKQKEQLRVALAHSWDHKIQSIFGILGE